jgi:hypothetical protein
MGKPGWVRRLRRRDLVIIATAALALGANWAIAAVWIFNVWAAADLLFAFYKGARVNLDPGALGAGFYIVTSVVPVLLVLHALIFALLMGNWILRLSLGSLPPATSGMSHS